MREGWTRLALGDVIKVNPKSPPLAADAPFITMDAVPVGGRFPTYTEARGDRTGARAAGGDTLLARITPCLENGKVAQVPSAWPACGGSTELLTLRATDAALPDFVFLLATSNSFRRSAEALMTGTTGRQRVSAADIASVDIDLPPLDEQRRIVDLIGSLDAAIAAVDDAVAKAEQARHAMLADLLTPQRLSSKPGTDDGVPADIGEEWLRSTLGDLAELSIGRTPPRNDPRYWTAAAERPFCTIGDMTARLITETREGVTELAEKEGRAKRVPAGTLLMSFKLTLGRIGFAAVDLFPNEAIVAIRPNMARVSADFLALSLSAADLSAISGTAVKGKTLNRESLRAIPVSVPPLDEQRRIVDIVSSLDAEVSALRATAHAARATRAALLSDLLSGKHEIPASYDRLLDAA